MRNTTNTMKNETVYVTCKNKKTGERQLTEFKNYPDNNPYTRIKKGWKIEKIERKFTLNQVIKNNIHNQKLTND